jgi:CRISPR-associated protein Csb2
MTTISIRFLTGRFHATQWGRHVNEGVPEWPPSPWRILRGLIATWKTKCPDLDANVAEGVLGKLATAPDFALPAATVSHTRHYMPWDKNYAGHTTLVFDTFVALPASEEILVCWPDANFPQVERIAMAKWLEQVNYLGRAESWCEMKLLSDAEEHLAVATNRFNCRQLGTQSPEKNAEIVRVHCPDPATAFLSTHTPKTKKAPKIPFYDPDWHICGETLWHHAEKWAEAPGSKWIRYTRPADCFKISHAPRKSSQTKSKPQVARFALDSSVLPLITETLSVAESARWNLMGHFGAITARRDGIKGKSEIFSGKDEAGNRLTHHGHCYFLPTDDDGDGRLDHLTLVAEAGFGKDELAAIHSLREIKSNKREASSHALGVVLLGTGMLADADLPSSLSPASCWVSATPYLCHRHPKTRGSKKDSAGELASPAAFTEARLREDIARLLERRADLKSISIANVKIAPLIDEQGVFRIGARKQRPIEFQRYRQKYGDDGGKRLCGAFVIEFPCEVSGPIALGHSCHFGMGLFLPWQEADFEPYKALSSIHPRYKNFTEEHLRTLHFYQFIAKDD